MGYPLTFAEATGEQQPRSGLSHPAVAPYDAYPTADGPDVLISVQNDSGEAARRLDRAGIANGRVNELSDVLRHPQLGFGAAGIAELIAR